MGARTAGEAAHPDAVGDNQMVEGLGDRGKEATARRMDLFGIELRYRAVDAAIGPAVVARHAFERCLPPSSSGTTTSDRWGSKQICPRSPTANVGSGAIGFGEPGDKT